MKNRTLLVPLIVCVLIALLAVALHKYYKNYLGSFVRATIDDRTGLLSEDPVELTLGANTFNIPVNYLIYKGSTKSKRKALAVTVSVFLPDYSGYKRAKFAEIFDPNYIEVTLHEDSTWSHRIENEILKRDILVSGRLVKGQEQELNRYGLKIYEQKREKHFDEILGFGEGVHGNLLMIECSVNAPNNKCFIEYHNRSIGCWIRYHYSLKNLKDWKDIDTKLNALFMSWLDKSVSPLI